MSRTECYSSAFSQPGTAVHNRVERSGTAYLWRSNGDANLKNVIYPGWSWEIICITSFIPSICTHVWQPSSHSVLCLCAMVAEDWFQRRCIVLAGQLQKQLWAKCLPASSCCLHMGIAATVSPGWMYLVTFQPWEILRQKLTLKCAPPKRSGAMFLTLLFRWECALEFGLKGRSGLAIVSWHRGSCGTYGCSTQHQECIQTLIFFFKIKVRLSKTLEVPVFPPDCTILSPDLLRGCK